MSRKLLIILSCLWCAVLFTGPRLSAQAKAHNDEAIDYKQPGAPMPALRVVMPDSSTPAAEKKNKRKGTATGLKAITSRDLNNGANLLVMMFNPTCGHCEEQTRLLTDHIFLFKNSRLVLLAGPMMLPYLEHFNQNTQVSGFPETILMGVDSAGFIDRTFLYETLPQINIYDHDRKLIKSFTGVTPIDTLKQYIE
jgi:thiol-disulfide isomerase/thioredoxin